MPLINRSAVIADSYTAWDGIGTPPQGDLIVSSEIALAHAALFSGRRIGVALENTADPLTLLPLMRKLSLIALSFPSFRDGRAYTQAAILREAGFAGELRATGRVQIDQVLFMARVGFTTFAMAEGASPAALATALSRYRGFYQRMAGEGPTRVARDASIEAAA